MAPVAFAGAIMAGLARFIEIPSLHAAEFGVGITDIAGSMSVLARLSTGDDIVPGGGVDGTSLMASGKAEELVNALPGDAVQVLPTLVAPNGAAAAIVPVVLPLTAPRIITGIAGGKLSGGLVGVVDIRFEVIGLELIGITLDVIDVTPAGGMAGDPTGLIDELAEGVVVAVTLSTEGERATAVGEQLKLVPGIVGSVANGGEASVVAGAPGIVDGEKRLTNGPGP